MELEGYSWPTCIKQSRRIDHCRCRQQSPPLMSFVDIIDLSWRNFQSPEFGTKFQREVPLFLEVTKFPYNQCGIGEGSLCDKNQLDLSVISIQYRLVVDTWRQHILRWHSVARQKSTQITHCPISTDICIKMLVSYEKWRAKKQHLLELSE